MRYRVSFFPDPHSERSTMNVFDDVNLALVLRQRQSAWPECQPPLASMIVDGQAYKIDERRARTTFGLILFIRTGWSPQACQIDLTGGRYAQSQHDDHHKNRNSPSKLGET